MTSTSVQVASAIRRYCKKEINASELISQLKETGIREISDSLISAYDIDVSGIKDMALQIAGENSLIIAYAAFTEAYKYFMSVLDDAAVQHEHRLIIERECEKTVSLIKEYRNKMQASITKYFEKHLNTFKYGFAQMDKAIEENDSNGYIKGNAEIQGVLGYYSQFRNQKEFDDLMESEISFKL